MKMHFAKYLCNGNDYLLLDGRRCEIPSREVMAAMCERTGGAGARGVVVLRSGDKNIRLHCFDAAGVEVRPSGDDLLCGARFAMDVGAVNSGDRVAVDTFSGEMAFVAAPEGVTLRLPDVEGVYAIDNFFFFNLITPQYVEAADDLTPIDPVELAMDINRSESFEQIGGAGVTFMQQVVGEEEKGDLMAVSLELGQRDASPGYAAGAVAAAIGAALMRENDGQPAFHHSRAEYNYEDYPYGDETQEEEDDDDTAPLLIRWLKRRDETLPVAVTYPAGGYTVRFSRSEEGIFKEIEVTATVRKIFEGEFDDEIFC